MKTRKRLSKSIKEIEEGSANESEYLLMRRYSANKENVLLMRVMFTDKSNYSY